MLLFPIAGCVLLVLAGLMLDSHRRTWQASQQQNPEESRSQRVARAQYLRRMQASGVLAGLGALLIVYPMIPKQPLPMVLYVLALVLCCGWILMLGVVDWFATWLRVRKSRDRSAHMREQLEAEIEAARERKR